MATKSLNEKWLSIVQSMREKGENEIGGSSTVTVGTSGLYSTRWSCESVMVSQCEI